MKRKIQSIVTIFLVLVLFAGSFIVEAIAPTEPPPVRRETATVQATHIKSRKGEYSVYSLDGVHVVNVTYKSDPVATINIRINNEDPCVALSCETTDPIKKVTISIQSNNGAENCTIEDNNPTEGQKLFDCNE
jgi:hypothetical protein